MNKFLRIFFKSLIISIFAVFLFDLPLHYFFSVPMETVGYFLIKFSLYFIFAFVFLLVFKKAKFYEVLGGGIVVALIWGAYYNLIPAFTNYSVVGIPLSEISFLGRGIFLTGSSFGIIHTLGFIIGFYVSKIMDLGREE